MSFNRYLTLLNKIPKNPNWATTAELHEYLKDEGYSVTKRTTERDLEKFSDELPLRVETEGRTKKWQWVSDAMIRILPEMSPNEALAFGMVEQHLLPMLPRAATRVLAPYFDMAADRLLETNLDQWKKNVRMLHRGPALQHPRIHADVIDTVYGALLDQEQFEGNYRRRGDAELKRYKAINPLGLVVKDGISYLVCSLGNYENPLQFALHRFTSAKRTYRAAHRPRGFDLSEYVESESGFSYPLSPDRIRLEARFDRGVAHHLSESKLSDDQELQDDGDKHVIVRVTVADTMEIRWWLLGFGEMVEVLGPANLRDEFTAMAANLHQRYSG